MLYRIFNKIKLLNIIKIRFDLPVPKKILQYDELNSNVLKKVIKKDFNVIPRHKPEIYFWILIKQIFFFDFTFLTYFKNYIKFTSPKIVINLIDNDYSYYKLKEHFKEIYFISIQNGVRPKTIPKLKKKFKGNLECDYIFGFNNYYIKEYKKIINSKYCVLGSIKNNIVKVNKTKYKKSFLFISRKEINPKLLNLLALYFLKSKKKLNILLKSKNLIDQNKEINFYKKFFNKNCFFHKTNSFDKSYKIIDKFENIIFTNSTMGYEAISRKKKVVVLALGKNEIYKEYFGWPKKNKNSNNFFSAKKLKYDEIRRVLNNVYNCKQSDWDKNHYKNIKDLMFLDKNNSKLIAIINNILNTYKN